MKTHLLEPQTRAWNTWLKQSSIYYHEDILQSVFFCIFSLIPAPWCLPHTPNLTRTLAASVEEGGPRQEAPKGSSKGAGCLFFGHATAPFWCKTPALSSPAGAKMRPNRPWFANPSVEQHIGPGVRPSEWVPWIDSQCIIISLFPGLGRWTFYIFTAFPHFSNGSSFESDLICFGKSSQFSSMQSQWRCVEIGEEI